MADNQTIDEYKWPYARVLRSYSRALAWAGLGEVDKFVEEEEHLSELMIRVNASQHGGWNPEQCNQLARVADALIRARHAVMDGDCAAAVDLMTEATNQQLQWRYTEPPAWHYPIRQCLGAVLLNCKRPAEAETVCRADLTQYLRNGWSLLGLSQAMK